MGGWRRLWLLVCSQPLGEAPDESRTCAASVRKVRAQETVWQRRTAIYDFVVKGLTGRSAKLSEERLAGREENGARKTKREEASTLRTTCS